jgi:YHS domain-containing protein
MTHIAPISRDPVCGMDVEIARSLHSTTHRGLVFHFCSAQCLERFQATPNLYTAPHSPAIPIRRRLRLAAGDGAGIERALRSIRAMMGISATDVEKDCLIVEYDLKQVSLAQIEAVAIDAGLKFKGGLHGLQRSLWKFAERNELDNAAHAGTGACCNHPPTRSR